MDSLPAINQKKFTIQWTERFPLPIDSIVARLFSFGIPGACPWRREQEITILANLYRSVRTGRPPFYVSMGVKRQERVIDEVCVVDWEDLGRGWDRSMADTSTTSLRELRKRFVRAVNILISDTMAILPS